MARPFTAFNSATRLILYSGTAARPDLLPHQAFEGVAADPATYRVTADGNQLEPKPDTDATLDPLSVAPGGSSTLTIDDSVRVYVDGNLIGELAPGAHEIEFSDVGSYTVRVVPVSQLTLEKSFTVTVA